MCKQIKMFYFWLEGCDKTQSTNRWNPDLLMEGNRHLPLPWWQAVGLKFFPAVTYV